MDLNVPENKVEPFLSSYLPTFLHSHTFSAFLPPFRPADRCHVPENQINEAKEKAKLQTRVAARKLYDFRNTPGGLNFKSVRTRKA